MLIINVNSCEHANICDIDMKVKVYNCLIKKVAQS